MSLASPLAFRSIHEELLAKMCTPSLLDERLIINSLEIPNRRWLVKLYPKLGLYTVAVYDNGCTVAVSIPSVN